jgi:hypothetical protein
MFKLGTFNAAKPLMLVAQAKPEGCTTTASLEVDQKFDNDKGTTTYHQYVRSYSRTLHTEKAMAEAVDDASRQLVRQRRRISKIRYDRKSLQIHLYSTESIGLRADDLIPEENDTVQLALKRLPPKEAYDRVFRLRRAFQV